MRLMRPLLKLASPAGSRARLSVLVLHRVLPQPDPVFPEALDSTRFAQLCRWVSSMFNVIPLDDAVRRLRHGSLPERALAITFDDGYADNCQVAMPVLRSMGLPATVFIATGFLDGGCMWNDIVTESFRRTRLASADLRDLLPQTGTAPFDLSAPLLRRHALETVISAVKYRAVDERLALVRQLAQHLNVRVPDDLMMRSVDVAALRRGGLQVGAHTVSHPILAGMDPQRMRQEMKGSKDHLERLLGEEVGLFAYPNGKPGEDFDDQAVALARELGFQAAVTTVRGAASATTDPFRLPRFTPWDRSAGRFALRMLATLWARPTPTPAAAV